MTYKNQENPLHQIHPHSNPSYSFCISLSIFLEQELSLIQNIFKKLSYLSVLSTFFSHIR